MEGRERGGKDVLARRFGDGMFARRGIDAVIARAANKRRNEYLVLYPSIDGRRSDGTEPTRAAVSSSRRIYTMVCDRLHSGHVARSPAASSPRSTIPSTSSGNVEFVETRDREGSPRIASLRAVPPRARRAFQARRARRRQSPRAPRTTDAASSNRRRAEAAAACPASPAIWFSLTLARLTRILLISISAPLSPRPRGHGGYPARRGSETQPPPRTRRSADVDAESTASADSEDGFGFEDGGRRIRRRLSARAPATISAAMADRSTSRSAAASVDPRVAVARRRHRRAEAVEVCRRTSHRARCSSLAMRSRASARMRSGSPPPPPRTSALARSAALRGRDPPRPDRLRWRRGLQARRRRSATSSVRFAATEALRWRGDGTVVSYTGDDVRPRRRGGAGGISLFAHAAGPRTRAMPTHASRHRSAASNCRRRIKP